MNINKINATVNLKALFSEDGHFSINDGGGTGFEVPKGSGIHSIFAGNMWIAEKRFFFSSVIQHFIESQILVSSFSVYRHFSIANSSFEMMLKKRFYFFNFFKCKFHLWSSDLSFRRRSNLSKRGVIQRHA